MLVLTGTILLASLLAAGEADLFPPELVNFEFRRPNPVFEAARPGNWDANIRERGWILREENEYHMWYTGYNSKNGPMKLGYATSPDGIRWTRYPKNPIYDESWVEDMIVVKVGDTYYMFAEGEGDHAQLLTSQDRIHWKHEGELIIRKTTGEPLSPGPFGTPAAWHEDGVWYLLYERNDEAVWLAKSSDLKTWTNVQDEPVIKCGPEPYDNTMIAVNQVIKYKDRYYAYYHAKKPNTTKNHWTMNVAMSEDLIHWTKYPGNPIIRDNFSSGILVDDGTQLRLYCMHEAVALFYPEK